MATFAELVDLVCKEVERPDFTFSADGGTGEAVRAVASSIYTLHTRELYKRDIAPAQVVFDTPAYLQLLDLTAFPRYRQMKYVRKWSPDALNQQSNPYVAQNVGLTASLDFLEEISPSSIFDYFNKERTNVWYLAGDTLYIKSDSQLQYALVGFYQFPDVKLDPSERSGSETSSWIAARYPFAVVYHAASKLYAMIGQQETARKYDYVPPRGNVGEGLVQQQLRILDADNI